MTGSSPHHELAAALRERLTVIADRAAYTSDATAHLQRLQQVSERIERLAKHLPTPVDPRLAHFLERRSYDKALALLEADHGAS